VSLNPTAVPARPATKIAVTSGKGGVGKTSLTINLGMAMVRLGHRVGILDADFALGNIDVLLGLTPQDHLGMVLDGVKTVGDVTLAGPAGLRIIPAGSGVRALTAIDERRWPRLVAAIEEAGAGLDFLLLDTASGIADNVLNVAALADYVLVVSSYEPAAVVDAYAVIKLLTARDRAKPIGVVVNGARDASEGGVVFGQISVAADRFLGRTLRYDGHVVEDRSVRDAVCAQTPLAELDAPGPAVNCIRRLAIRLTSTRPVRSGPWPAPGAGGPPPTGLDAPRCA
jgi:flagellar biosynthesis protein FlhG